MLQTGKILHLDRKLILASQSPRRKFLLQNLGFEFDIIPAHLDENIDESMKPDLYAATLALHKAQAVAENHHGLHIVIGADTIVMLDGKILNKPKSEEEAYSMLKTLSGRTHTVYTGIALVATPEFVHVFDCEETEVTFRELEDEEIWAYIETGSPLDKAGAYGIQDDFGAVFVSRIEGCYYNIVGLPLQLLYRKLKDFILELK